MRVVCHIIGKSRSFTKWIIRLVSDLAFVYASCDKSSITLIQYRQLSGMCCDLPHVTINSFTDGFF